jgi:drug/metabolite transporter (DMT)-like permease
MFRQWSNTNSAMNGSSPKGVSALPALLCGATGIAFAPLFVRFSEIGPSATAFWRLALAWPFLFLWLQIDCQRHPPRKRISFSDRKFLALSGLFFAGDLAIWHWSIKFTTVANSTLLANFAPIFVTLAAWFFFRAKITMRFFMGLVIAFGGAFLLMGSSLKLSDRFIFGDILGIATAVFYAGYLLTVNRLRNRFSTARIMAWGGFFCALTLFPIALFSEETLFPATYKGWLVLFGLALISQIGGQGLITYALAYLPAPFASLSLLLQPVLAAVFAWIILKEPVGMLQGLGGVVILSGIITAKRNSATNYGDSKK